MSRQLHVRKPVAAILSVRIPRDVLIALDERARGEDSSVSEIVRRALGQYLGGTHTTSSATVLTVKP